MYYKYILLHMIKKPNKDIINLNLNIKNIVIVINIYFISNSKFRVKGQLYIRELTYDFI